MPNRRALERQLGLEWARLSRSQEPLALLFIDADHFKPFNDHYGQAFGDACLRELACHMRVVRALLDAVVRLTIAHTASPIGSHVTISIGLAGAQPHQAGPRPSC